MKSRLAAREFLRSCLKILSPAPLLLAVAMGCSANADPPGGGQNSLIPCQQPGVTMPCSCGTAQGTAVCGTNLVMSQCSCLPPLGAGGQITGMGGATSSGGGGGGSVQGSGGTVSTGNTLPCDVQKVLDAKCHECHQNPPQFTAPMPLTNWDELHRNSTQGAQAGTAISQLVKERINKVGTGQMPPANMPQLTDGEKATLTSWITAGAQPGTSCTPTGTGGAGGSGGSGGAGGSGGTGSGSTGNGAATGNYSEGPPPADCKDFYTLHAHGAQGAVDKTPFSVRPAAASNAGNTYTCFYFKPPYAPDSQGLWFHPDLDKKAILHHWLLYATDNLDPTKPVNGNAPCQAVEPGAYLVAGWAPGTKATSIPADVGLHLPTGPNAGLILEVHHYNTSADVLQDSSGVTFCTAPPNTRPHTAGVSFTGSEGICLQPNTQGQVGGNKSICNPPDAQDIHIINIWPHMHKLGKRMMVNVKRAGGEVVPLHDKPFDFNTQVTYPVSDFVMKAGDTLETTCFFENNTADAVHFGERTQDEMCYGFITAWPYQGLVSDPTTINFLELIGTGIQQVNRCMNLVGILDSCNGLSDYPVAK